MKKLFKIITTALTLGILATPLVSQAATVGWTRTGTVLSPLFSGDSLLMSYLGGSGTRCLQVDNTGAISTAATACGSGGGGSGGGTWATTSSQVLGQYINYSLNDTDIITIGNSATTSAEFWFDPNTIRFFLSGNGTTTGNLSVFKESKAQYFTATSTLRASTFPYASTTALTVSGVGGLTIGTLTGPLQAIGGQVTASSTLSVAYGGTSSTTLTGLLKGNGVGPIQTAIAGTDYQAAGSYALQATTITVNGTANQITSSAGAQDLSANRTWTLSLPSPIVPPGQINMLNDTAIEYGGGSGSVTQEKTGTDGTRLTDLGGNYKAKLSSGKTYGVYNADYNVPVLLVENTGNTTIYGSTTLQNFTGRNSTTTNATTTSLNTSALKVASLSGVLTGTSGVVGTGVDGTDFSLIKAQDCTGTGHLLSVTAAGVFTCSADSGGSSSWATTSQDYYNSRFRDWKVDTDGSLTPTTTIGIKILGASSTLQNFTGLNSTTTNATTTSLNTSALKVGTLSGVLKGTSGVISTGADGTDYTLVNALTCGAGQHFSDVTAAGVFTCTADSGGGGGGSDVNWTFFNGTALRPATSTNAVLIGGSSTSTLATLEVQALSASRGALLVTGSSTLQDFTSQNSTTTNATTTNMATTNGYVSGSLNIGSAEGSTAYLLNVTKSFNSFVDQVKFSNPSSGSNAGLGIVLINDTGSFNGFQLRGSNTTNPFTGVTGDLTIRMFDNAPISFVTNNLFRGMFSAAGNFGIGTTSPYAPLSVNGQAVALYYTATSTTQASTFPYASTTAISISNLTSGNCVQAGTGGLLTTVAAACGSGSGGGGTGWASSTDTRSIYFTGSKSVGIGTTTPNLLSDLNLATTSPMFILTATGAGSNAKHLFNNWNGSLWSIGTTSDAMNATSSAALTLNPVGSPAFGIGTSSPNASLAVVGNGVNDIFAVATSTAANNSQSVFAVDKVGHQFTSGPKPACDANCTFIGGNDNAFRVNLGTTITTSTITFSSTWGALAPICVANEGSAGTVAVEASSTPTTVVITAASALTAKDVDVQCIGIR